MAGDKSAAQTASAAQTEAAASQDTKGPRVDLSGKSDQPHAAVEFDKATEKRLLRKLDRRLVLLAFLCCKCLIL